MITYIKESFNYESKAIGYLHVKEGRLAFYFEEPKTAEEIFKILGTCGIMATIWQDQTAESHTLYKEGFITEYACVAQR